MQFEVLKNPETLSLTRLTESPQPPPTYYFPVKYFNSAYRTYKMSDDNSNNNN